MATQPYLESVPDGLPMRDSGPWVARKLIYLRRYIDVFETSMRHKWPTRTYIDLFAGPGKCLDRESGAVYLGSPLLAVTTRHPFTDYYFVDQDEAALAALKQRADSSQVAGRIRYIPGDANAVVASVVDALRGKPSLNLAFLDPDGLELSWSTVAILATIQRVDLIVHYPQMGLSRFMPAAASQASGTQIDRFFGGAEWRVIFDAHRRGEESFLHRHLMDHYKARLSALGYADTSR